MAFKTVKEQDKEHLCKSKQYKNRTGDNLCAGNKKHNYKEMQDKNRIGVDKLCNDNIKHNYKVMQDEN